MSFFIILYLHSLWSISALEHKKVNEMKKINALQKKFFSLKTNYPQIFFSSDINQSIMQLKRELRIQQEILKNITNQVSFSQNLLALSRMIVPNVWLTEIMIDKSGQVIILKGNSIGAQNFHAFLQNLSQDNFFSKYTLNINNMEDTSKMVSNGTLTFEVSMAKKTQ